MMNLAWFIAGALVGLLNALAMSVAVRRLAPSAPARSLFGLAGGTAVRWACIAMLLAVALRQGSASGLLAFAGLWLARWAAIVWWSGSRGKGAE
jgi:hypothetical protein